jgi:hypothetical protein
MGAISEDIIEKAVFTSGTPEMHRQAEVGPRLMGKNATAR